LDVVELREELVVTEGLGSRALVKIE